MSGLHPSPFNVFICIFDKINRVGNSSGGFSETNVSPGNRQADVAIELDGETHYTAEAMEYDRIRDNYLKTVGITVIRYSNHQIDISKNRRTSPLFNEQDKRSSNIFTFEL